MCLNYEYPAMGGGAGNATQQTAIVSSRRGHRVDVVTSRLPAQSGVASDGSLVIYRVYSRRQSIHQAGLLGAVSYVFSALFKVRRLARTTTTFFISISVCRGASSRSTFTGCSGIPAASRCVAWTCRPEQNAGQEFPTPTIAMLMPDADTIAGTRDESFGEPEAGISIRGDPASAVEPSGALCPIAPRVVIHSGLHATRLTVIAAEPCPACSPSIQAISPPGPVAPGVAGCETPRRFSSHSAAELKAAFVTGVANGDDCAVSNSPQVLVVDPDGKLRVESYSASLEAMAGVTQAVLDETGLRDDGGAAGRR